MPPDQSTTTTIVTRLMHEPLFVVREQEFWLYELFLFFIVAFASLLATQLVRRFIKKNILPKLQLSDRAIHIALLILSWLVFFGILIFALSIIHIEIWPIAVAIWDTSLFTLGARSVKVSQITLTMVFAVMAHLLTLRWMPLLRDVYLPRIGITRAAAESMAKIAFYVANGFIVIFIFIFLAIDITMFAFLGGAIAIAVGFGAQNLLNNFISGVILLVERPVKVGDLVEFDGMIGTIEEITARCTRLRAPGNIHLLIPNSILLENTVTNWSYSDEKVRTRVSVGVAYGSPVEDVMRLMKQAADESSKVHKKPEPFVLFQDFGDNSLNFDVYFWIDVYESMDKSRAESEMRVRIDALFREAGITIAYPQRDIHLDTLKPLEVKVVENKSDKA